MRVCDLVADYIYNNGIEDVFVVSGGGLMFLTDGLACQESCTRFVLITNRLRQWQPWHMQSITDLDVRMLRLDAVEQMQ